MQFTGKTYWLIGASAGIGHALAHQLDQMGARLILSARNGEKLAALQKELTQECCLLPLDVTDKAASTKAVEKAAAADGVIYMAGDYDPMPAQKWNVERAQMIADINYMAAQRLLGQLLPQFLARNAGHVVIIGSLAGYAGLPGAMGYGASKAALMHLAQNLYVDLKSTNIKVQMVNPGFVKTRLTQKNTFKMPFITTPERAASIIVHHMQTRRFSRSFPPLFSWILKLRALWYLMRL